MFRTLLAAGSLLALSTTMVMAEDVGSVDTTFRIAGSNDKIAVEVFDDPGVNGVSCYLSRARTGGLNPFATDPSDASVACRQISAQVSFPAPIPQTESVFSERASFLFKHVHVTRMVDSKRNVLIYLVHSDKLIDGSPKNSVTAVPSSKETPIPLKK